MLLIVVALIVLVWHVGQKCFRRATGVKEKKRRKRDEVKPYFQAKAELDAEAKERNGRQIHRV